MCFDGIHPSSYPFFLPQFPFPFLIVPLQVIFSPAPYLPSLVPMYERKFSFDFYGVNPSKVMTLYCFLFKNLLLKPKDGRIYCFLDVLPSHLHIHFDLLHINYSETWNLKYGIFFYYNSFLHVVTASA
jgi:hypothetical protein